MTILLVGDQSCTHSAYSISRDGIVINVWCYVSPKELKNADAQASWQQIEFTELLNHIERKYSDSSQLQVGLEGTFLNKTDANTKRDLDELVGRLKAVCDIKAIPYHIIPVTDMGKYLGLPYGTRQRRKTRAIYLAHEMLTRDDRLPDLAAALGKVYDFLSDWQPNVSGSAKTFETMLNRANTLMPSNMIIDIADSICLGDIAYRKLQQEAIERL